MTLPISRDLDALRIRCNTIAPGYFDTPILGNIPKKVRTFLESTVPNPPRFVHGGEKNKSLSLYSVPLKIAVEITFQFVGYVHSDQV